MSQQVIELNCPGCGAKSVLVRQNVNGVINLLLFRHLIACIPCPCQRWTSMPGAYRKALAENPDDITLNNSVAMYYLKLKLYDKALPAFERAMEDNFDNSETFSMRQSVCFRGKKLFGTKIAIDKIEEYINAALIELNRRIYYYFHAYA